jgi:hypothetical protein
LASDIVAFAHSSSRTSSLRSRRRDSSITALSETPVRAVAEVERPGRLDRDALFAQTFPHGLFVINDQSEVPRPVGRLRPSGGDCDELVAHVDERHATDVTAAQVELEEPSIPGEGFVDVADLECDVVDADQSGHCSEATVARSAHAVRMNP